MNKNNVNSRLLKLEEYIQDLKKYRAIDIEEYKKDIKTKRFLERTLHLAIESCLDIGSHIISEKRWGAVEKNTDIIEILAENDLIKKNREIYIKMAKFRNIIVHDYSDIDDKIVYQIIQYNLDDLINILKWYREFILYK